MGKPKGKGKQEKLFDTTHPAHKEIVALCEELHEARSARLESQRDECAASEKLLAVMHEHNMSGFTHNGITAEIVVEKEKVKVKIKASEGEDGDDDE